jgi:hypothetical protein
MTLRFIVCVCAFFAGVNGASAAIWAWGCQGQLGQQLVIFDRNTLFFARGKLPRGDVRKAIEDKMTQLTQAKDAGYEDQNGNEGFEDKTRSFARRDEPKKTIVLTEKSSHRTSHRSRLICGRDETIDTFRKIFRIQREGEPPRDLTMQCFEYMLSTRGGRPGCD